VGHEYPNALFLLFRQSIEGGQAPKRTRSLRVWSKSSDDRSYSRIRICRLATCYEPLPRPGNERGDGRSGKQVGFCAFTPPLVILPPTAGLLTPVRRPWTAARHRARTTCPTSSTPKPPRSWPGQRSGAREMDEKPPFGDRGPSRLRRWIEGVGTRVPLPHGRPDLEPCNLSGGRKSPPGRFPLPHTFSRTPTRTLTPWPPPGPPLAPSPRQAHPPHGRGGRCEEKMQLIPPGKGGDVPSPGWGVGLSGRGD